MFDQVSNAIVYFNAAFRDKFEKVLLDTVNTAGASTAKVLRGTLRAAAPTPAEIRGFKFDQTNPAAQDYATRRAGELIQSINETTRDAIRELVESAFEEQFDVDDLADEIEDIIGDSARAETIARTETMKASNEGQSQAWGQAVQKGLLVGDEKKEWITTPDDRLCPICEPLDGQQVGLDEPFDVDGDQVDAPPAHPNCRCTMGLSV